MKLTNGELFELAEFFAKRFPEVHHRTRLAKEAKVFHLEEVDVTPAEAWQTLLAKAQGQGRLHGMARTATSLATTDENLASVCDLLWATRPGLGALAKQHSTAVGLILAVALGSLGALSIATGTDGGDANAAPAEALTAHTTPDDPSLAPSEASPASEPTSTPTMPASKGAAASTLATAPPASAGGSTVQRWDLANDHGRCTTPEPGALVGYWYAGEDAAGTSGQSITMDHMVNVRADYPDHRNGFDKRATIRCVLMPGDVVQLSHEGVLVPGNRYWMPIHSDDIVSRASSPSSQG